MTRGELKQRFGDKIGEEIPLTASDKTSGEPYSEREDPKQDAWQRAEIWEIWYKKDKKLFWWCKDYPTILDEKPDPLKLTGFYPIPEPMAANVTTTAYVPIPDYIMAQDLYNEIDQLETRITRITEAVKVVGVYDQAAEGVKRMMMEAVENDLIPVDNWDSFSERGGLKGTIEWFPIQEIASTMMILVERRNDAKKLLYEITGISDIMRGAQSAGGAVSATERALEARFASVRIQSLQDEFAKYATDLIRLRAEVVSKHFQPKSIYEQSNIGNTPDAELAEAAIKLIKDTTSLVWRIEVKPESVAMVDYAQLKEERTAYITALATFMQSSAPLVQMSPEAAPVLLEMLKWGLAGFKGSNEVEGVLDQAINMMQQQPKQEEQQQPPSPEEIKAETEKARQAFEKEKMQMQQQMDQQKIQAQQQMLQLEGQLREKELELETQKDLQKEAAQAQLNMQEEEHETAEYQKRKDIDIDTARRMPPPKSSGD